MSSSGEVVRRGLYQRFNVPKRSSYLREVPGANVYLVYSRSEIPYLLRILAGVKYFQVIRRRDIHRDLPYSKVRSHETYSRIALIKKELYNEILAERWPYFMIRPFKIDTQRDYPGFDQSYNIFLPNCSTAAGVEALEAVLNSFSEHQIISPNSWTIVRRSRGSYLRFNDDVPNCNIVITKVLLNISQNQPYSNCRWEFV